LSELKVVSAKKVHEELTRKLGLVMSDIEENSAALANIQRLALGFRDRPPRCSSCFDSILFRAQSAKRRSRSNRARKEPPTSLRTVNEGLFLLDRKHENRHGEKSRRWRAFSAGGFRQSDVRRIAPLFVPEKTLKTAQDYVALLWGDRVNES